MPTYAALRNKQTQLIRKALDGSVFISDDLTSAGALADLTSTSASTLAALPVSYDDLGWLTEDGAQFARDVSSSDIRSWGSVTPTRSDVTADTSTMTVVAQETKLLTIGLATGADLSAITADATTGEVVVQKPTRAASKVYRALSLAVDQGDSGEIYIARYFPRAKVTGFSPQSFGGGDDPITWGVTLTAEEDSDVGYSESWIFGGPGWKAILADMGITSAP